MKLSSVSKEIKAVVLWGGVLSAAAAGVSLIFAGVNLYFLLGILTGYVLSVINFVATAAVLSGAIKRFEKAAMSDVILSYIVRITVIGVALTLMFKKALAFGFGGALPLLFPKIIFTVGAITKKGV